MSKFQIVKIKIRPYKDMYGVMRKEYGYLEDFDVDIKVFAYEVEVTCAFPKEHLRVIKLQSIKDKDIKKRIKRYIELEEQKDIEGEI